MKKYPLIRKGLAVGIILLFIEICIIPAIAQDIEKPLSTSRGNWLYVGGSGPGNYTKIQDAIDNAFDDDNIFANNVTIPRFTIHNSSNIATTFYCSSWHEQA